MANDPSWYLNRPQGKSGPHTWAELQSLAAQGQISPQDGVWNPAAARPRKPGTGALPRGF
ncbi:GYF domain-containing protein [Levilinea saccharolytica]|uniref:GYF domain-containing protein n=1 Tax=Levilinea saccharolytica TaxID=229921 RepID=UPI0009466FCD|nr:GYF domain-containing protein [Levilinea saccharolytica]